MRGAQSDHTLVLLNGLELNDPSQGRRFDFAHLTTQNVKRIEVLRGPQSTLWGSDALGGVINIVTKDGTEEPRFTAGGEGGSFYTAREWASFTASPGMFDLSLNASRVDSRSIDATVGGGDRDPYAKTTGSFRLGVNPTEQFGLDMAFRARDSLTEVDFDRAATGDDELDERKVYFRVRPRLTLFDGTWEQSLHLGVTDHNRKLQGTAFDNTFDGRFYTVDWKHTIHITEDHTLIGGYEYERESFDQQSISPASASLHSVYLQDKIRFWERLILTAGLRHNEHETFGGETTYRAAAAYLLKETGTKLRTSYGTGFRAPSLTQLFGTGPFVPGNRGLEPETSDGFDVGIDQELGSEDRKASLTWFYNDFSDLIAFAGGFPGGNFRNVRSSTSQGVEASLRWRWAENLRTRMSYTYTDVDADGPTARLERALLLKRAPHKVGAGVDYTFADERARVGLNLTYVSDRPGGFSRRATLEAHTLVNLTASYQVTELARVFGRVENALDVDYQEAFGFNTPGVAAYGGVEMTF